MIKYVKLENILRDFNLNHYIDNTICQYNLNENQASQKQIKNNIVNLNTN